MSKFPNVLGSLSNGFDVTPADDTDLGQFTRGIMVSGAGAITGVMSNGTGNHTTHSLSTGILYPFEFRQIHATGTTATGIKGYN